MSFSGLEEAAPLSVKRIGLDNTEYRQLIGVRGLMHLSMQTCARSLFCNTIVRFLIEKN
jgi:hypothetical protein